MPRGERRLRVPDEVAALIRSLHPGLKRKVKAALQMMLEEPECGKALKNELAGLRSFRVGRFRIVYRLAGATILEVVAIGPRITIYEETYRLIHEKKRR